jgi:chromosome segregation ATPase
MPMSETGDDPVAGRSGPLQELLFRDTVAALHAELEQRTGETTRLRGAVADLQSELTARAAAQAGVEAMLGDLRAELHRLREIIEQRSREHERALAEAQAERAAARDALACERAAAQRRIAQLTVSRGAALSEVAGLRAELERLGAEGAAAREELTAHSGNLGEAQRLLDDVRALADDLRGTSSQ